MQSNSEAKWQVVWEKQVEKRLAKMDATMRDRIRAYMDEVALLPDPRLRGKMLTGSRKGQWRYRVGDYRVICKIKDKVVTITVIDAGHRKDIYDW